MAGEPFPIVNAPDPGFAPGGRLQTLLAEKIKNAPRPQDFQHLGIVLVDLTRSTGTSASGASDYAGINDVTEMRAFSLAKIGIMFSAFRLRERVRQAVQGSTEKTPSAVFQQLTADWQRKIETRVPELRRDSPQWSDIFRLTGSAGAWKAEFSETGQSWDQLEAMHGEHGASFTQVAAIGFMERLKLMVAHSDNQAAGACLRQQGYQYVNGALVSEGFQEKGKHKTGLWIGSDYVGIRSAGYFPPSPPAPIGDLTQGASAKAVAALLTLLAKNRLVDAASSQQMREMMDATNGTRSFWEEGLRKANRRSNMIFRKIGMNGVQSEGGLIFRSTPTGLIKYAAVGLGSPTVKPYQELIVLMDDCIVENNKPAAAKKP